MRIGYLGGTFDPPHLAHFRIAERVLELNLVDKVLFAPAFAPPHKNNERLSSFADRCEMVRLMCEGVKHMALSRVEAELHFYPSYTIRVLDALKKRYPADELALLCGGDSLRTLHLWFAHNCLVDNYRILTYPRPGEAVDLKYLQRYWSPERAQKLLNALFQADCLDISSSELRKRLRCQEPVDGMLSEKVINYIKQHQLYLV